MSSDRTFCGLEKRRRYRGDVVRVDILVVSYRVRDYLVRCLASLAKNTGDGFRLTVYDNRPHNYPLTWIWNRFAEASGREALIFLNPDAMVGPGWDEEIIQCFQGNPNVAVAAPVTNSSQHHGITGVHNPVPNNLEIDGLDNVQQDLLRAVPNQSRFYVSRNPRVGCGHCFAVRRDVWDQLGRFNEREYPFAGNEDEFNTRVVKAGMDLAICTRAFSFHYWNKSVNEAEEAGELEKGTYRPKFSKPPEGLYFFGA